MQKVRAKFECYGIQDQPEFEQKQVSLSAVTTGTDENKSFSKFTPAAVLSMAISYETPACNFFEVGKEYYLDISPVSSDE